MNQSALRIEWDQSNKKEIEEAKTLYRKAKQQGRTITTLDGKEISAFRAYYKGLIIKEVKLEPTEMAVRIFDETGDRRLIWDMSDPEQIQDAAALFKEYLDKGWKAYAVDEEGNRGCRIYNFDAQNEELWVDDRSTKEKLAAFAEKIEKKAALGAKKAEEKIKTKKESLAAFSRKFKNMKLVPRTYPG